MFLIIEKSAYQYLMGIVQGNQQLLILEQLR